MKRRQLGFTLVEIMIVVGIIALLAMIALPSLFKARTQSQTKTCINNLRLMSNAKEQAALASMWSTGKTITDGSADSSNVLQYLKGSKLPVCPASGTYTWRPIGVDPVCSRSTDGHILPN
jgi:prepilin-type N-terminal cleavage/methylation domain-containing protein